MTARPLRVALLAPISWRVPPRHYGPWEQFVSLLAEGLVRRGVDVTLFATADSVTSARLRACAPRGYSEDPTLDAKVWESLHISALFDRAAEFDLIHNSFDFLPLTYSGLVDTPVVTTIHGFSSERIVPVYEKYNGRTYYVAISAADRHDKLEYLATIHHGIDMQQFELRSTPGEYLLFFGRIHPDKGTVEAIDVARRAGLPLVIAGVGLILLGAAAFALLPKAVASLESQTENISSIPVAVKYAAPDLSLTDVAGTPASLTDFRGQVVLVNLWATWCPPCRAEMPAIQKVYEEYQGQGLVVLGINSTVQDELSAVAPFIVDYGLTFPILLDETGQVSSMYQLRSLPSSYFIDRAGVIRYVVSGPMSEALLYARIEELLK